MLISYVHCLRILIYFYILRSVCLFCSKQATNILKTTRIFLLMAQFYNVPSNFANLASGGDRRWLLEPTTCLVQNNGKGDLFSENWSHMMMPKKNTLQDFYDIFYLRDDKNWYG